MFTISYATMQDKHYVCTDKKLTESKLELKIRDKMCYVLRYNAKHCNMVNGAYAPSSASPSQSPEAIEPHYNNECIGVMVYNLIFDLIPFLTMMYIEDDYQRKGFGTKAMAHWENEMRSHGHKMIMVSTQVDEDAQHFYRKLGYKDMGSIIMNIPPYEQPMEIFMGKAL